jgi:hypothetical protein
MTQFVCFLTLFAAQQAKPVDQPAQIVSRMLAKYAKATSLTGEIVWTQQLKDTSIVTKTVIQFESPSKLYIGQERTGSDGKSVYVVSDGTQFSYPVPPDLPARPGERLFEPVQLGNKAQSFRDIYGVVSRSLLDRSLPHDVAIARLEDLKFLREQWVTMEKSATAKVGDEELVVIRGSWRAYGSAPASGTYEMWISPSDELRRYVLRERLEIEQMGIVDVVGIWDCKLVIDGKPNPELFVVKKR